MEVDQRTSPLPDDNDSDDETLPPDAEKGAKIAHGSRCILCGSTNGLIVHRIVMHHGAHSRAYLNPLPWIHALGFVEPDPSEFPLQMDNHMIGNLMIVCEAHADAYDFGVWSLVPAASTRERMLRTVPPIVTRAKQESPVSQGVRQGHILLAEGSASLTQQHLYQTEPEPDVKELFDLAVFLPNRMPALDLLEAPDSINVKVSKSDIEAGRCPRVLPGFRNVALNRYIVYASALPMLNAAYVPLPDKQLKAVGQQCLEIREVWNNAVLANRKTPEVHPDLVDIIRDTYT
ncbi:hypothetical protein FKP32DRAFT_1754683 [Trametes sanguinea]|nr:hypothetical protein FKP32DRAFT_1754683 [Trametes sanguinea]